MAERRQQYLAVGQTHHFGLQRGTRGRVLQPAQFADASAHAIRQLRERPQDAGTYHLAAAGVTTWFEYAKYVVDQAKQARTAIKIVVTELAPIPTNAYPTPARRPHNSRLDTRKLQSVFGLTLPPWQVGVRRMLTEIC